MVNQTMHNIVSSYVSASIAKENALCYSGQVQICYLWCIPGYETFIISAVLARPGWAIAAGWSQADQQFLFFPLLPVPSPIQGRDILKQRHIFEVSWETILQVFEENGHQKTHPSILWQSSSLQPKSCTTPPTPYHPTNTKPTHV